MEFDPGLFVELFARTFSFWWIILPAILLGLVVGAIPGFSAANTIIILLPLTLAMDPEPGLVFMVALYAPHAWALAYRRSWSTFRAPPAPPPRRSTATR